MPRLPLLVPLLFLLGCGDKPAVRGSGHVTIETRPVPAFRRVCLSGFAHLVVTPNQPHQLEIHAEDNVHRLLTAAVTADGVLELGYDAGARVRPRQPVIFAVSAPTLDGITRAGVGGLRVAGHLRATRFELASAGGGDIILDQITADELFLRVSGEGSLTAAGTATRLNLLLQPGANPFAAKLADLTATAAEVDVSGGDAAVTATETLTVTARRDGRVWYAGTPKLTVTADDPEQVRSSIDGGRETIP